MTIFRIISKWFIFRNPNALHAGGSEKLENERTWSLSFSHALIFLSVIKKLSDYLMVIKYFPCRKSSE